MKTYTLELPVLAIQTDRVFIPVRANTPEEATQIARAAFKANPHQYRPDAGIQGRTFKINDKERPQLHQELLNDRGGPAHDTTWGAIVHKIVQKA